jgi:hypothetical protein
MSGEIAKDRSYPGVFYIGLGDQFDDDRRLVRVVTPEFRPALGPALTGSSHPVITATSRPPLGSNEVTLPQSALAVFARLGWRASSIRNHKPKDG